ncbi:monocarboxylate transporter 14-like [Ruditapes philippinarum]|uniref:monocarboxylate transporter 14-like n=1 Tax=Ruditapes philippinarum TaxID=129788 RepID=UPI00295B8B49|nr:monocarboxylate transporter 14-like [Ruditapes philippinarum]
MAVSFGILYSEIKTELKTSHVETAWIFSFFNGLLGLTGLPLGFLLHKTNERWLTVIGTFFLIAGMISSSFASKISTLYITYGVISGVGAGIVHYCANTIIVRHFSSKWCPLAITIANSGSAVSSLVFPPVLTASIQSYGWKTTFMLLSGTSAVGLFSAASYVAPDKDIDTKISKEAHHDEYKDDPKKHTEPLKVRKMAIEVLKNCKFMVFFISSFTAFTVIFVPSTFLPDFMRHAQRSRQEISACVMVMGFGNLLGRLISGAIATRFNQHVPWIHGLTLLGLAFSTILLAISKSLISLIVLSLLLGLFSGGFFGLYTAVVAHYLDRSHIPVGLGLTIAANGISSTTGMPLAGFVSDLYDGDDGAFVFGGCMMFFAALILSVNVIKEFFSKNDVSTEYEVEITRF